MALALRYSAHSEVGLVRKNNQDSGYASERLLVVADGMGGAAAGDLASTVAVARLRALDKEISREEEPPTGEDLLSRLALRVHEANEMLADLAGDYPDLDGMGTTVTAAGFDGTDLAVVHIGDSRMYRLRGEECVRVTHDHSWVQSLVDEGRLSPEEAADHPHRSLLLRVLNGAPSNDPDVGVIGAAVGDRLMLCSDGLCGLVDDADIARMMAIPDPAQVMEQLVRAAHEGGGSDNITIVLADVVDTDDFGQGDRAEPATPLTVGAAESTGIPEISESTQEIPIAPEGLVWPVVVDTEGNPIPEDVATQAEDLPVQSHDIGPVPVATPPRPEPATGDPGAGTSSTSPGPTSTGPTSPGREGPASPTTRTDNGAPPVTDEDEDARYSPKPAPPASRRLINILLAVGIAMVLVIVASVGAWAVWRNSYYVAADEGHVAIYRGFDTSIGPWQLHTVLEREEIPVADLSPRFQSQVDSTITVESLDAARASVAELAENAEHCRTVRAAADAEAEEANRRAQETAQREAEAAAQEAAATAAPGESPSPAQPSFSPDPIPPDYGEC